MTWWLAVLIFSSIVTGFASARWIEHYAARQRLEVARGHEVDVFDFLKEGTVYRHATSDDQRDDIYYSKLLRIAPNKTERAIDLRMNGESLITTTDSTVTVDLPALRRLAIGKTLEWKE